MGWYPPPRLPSICADAELPASHSLLPIPTVSAEMGAIPGFAFPRSWHFRNAGAEIQIWYRNAERERIGMLNSWNRTAGAWGNVKKMSYWNARTRTWRKNRGTRNAKAHRNSCPSLPKCDTEGGGGQGWEFALLLFSLSLPLLFPFLCPKQKSNALLSLFAKRAMRSRRSLQKSNALSSLFSKRGHSQPWGHPNLLHGQKRKKYSLPLVIFLWLVYDYYKQVIKNKLF